MSARTDSKPPKKKSLPVITKARTPVSCLSCALCCTYVAVEISAPDSVRTATEILWYLYHERVSIYCGEGDEWFVQFETRCRNLLPDNKCAIYEHRPVICREHSEVSCEVNAEDEGLSFFSPQAFLAYMKERSRRIHALVLKRHPPADERVPKAPFERRFRALRVLGEAPQA